MEIKKGDTVVFNGDISLLNGAKDLFTVKTVRYGVLTVFRDKDPNVEYCAPVSQFTLWHTPKLQRWNHQTCLIFN